MLLQLRNIRFRQVFFVKISEQTTNFFSMTRVPFALLIFLAKLCLKVGGAAYTQERLIHECLRYTGLLLSFHFLALCRLHLHQIQTHSWLVRSNPFPNLDHLLHYNLSTKHCLDWRILPTTFHSTRVEFPQQYRRLDYCLRSR